ncbi:hypothetical protein RN001_002275 [Aquatica leii]|uniref:Uncharacterized protein n=1 Tax=Aquatica leii TaxID=1421715 RepID=A0AAN7SLR6_9COLE|nr:hypothetical protein RN001_002275 [Aquatica leii]
MSACAANILKVEVGGGDSSNVVWCELCEKDSVTLRTYDATLIKEKCLSLLIMESLKFDNLSTEEFDTYWKACRQFRMAEIKTVDSTASILDKWPFYKTASGFRLIDMDFDALYTIGEGLLSKWENKRVHILQFLTSENNVKGVLDYTQKHEVDETMDKDYAVVSFLEMTPSVGGRYPRM